MSNLADPRFEVMAEDSGDDWYDEHGALGPRSNEYQKNDIRRVIRAVDGTAVEVIWLEPDVSVSEITEVTQRLFGDNLSGHLITDYGCGEDDEKYFLTIYLDT